MAACYKPDWPGDMMIDLPPDMQERVVCSITAAVKYEIPANIWLSIAEKEGGKPGQWKRNVNGTYDIGSMQLNTDWIFQLFIGEIILTKKIGMCPGYDHGKSTLSPILLNLG